MKIAIGADHGGYDLKGRLIEHLKSKGHQLFDFGTSSNEAVDYPMFARAVAEAVAGGQAERGVVIDGAGIGSCMTANKISGVRASMAYDVSSANNAREHNDANVLTLGAGLIGASLAKQIVDVFMTTDCVEPRHQRRVAMIDETAHGSPTPAVTTPAISATDGGIPGLTNADVERIVAKLECMVGSRLAAGAAPEGPGVASCPDAARHLRPRTLRRHTRRRRLLHRPHHPQAQRHPRPGPQNRRRGPRIRVPLGLRESVLGEVRG